MNDDIPLTLHSFPRAILHIDGDAFFASCEQARDPQLQGKPVITGKERGIAASMSYEAKARGVTRGMRLFEIKRLCPDAVILPSDYETYSLLSQRLFAIVRRYTPEVEEYGIDESFSDLTGLRRPLRMSYEEMAVKINLMGNPPALLEDSPSLTVPGVATSLQTVNRSHGHGQETDRDRLPEPQS